MYIPTGVMRNHGYRVAGGLIIAALLVAILQLPPGQNAKAHRGNQTQSQNPQQQTIFVDADAPGPTHDGAAWDTAYLYLQDALTASAEEDQIWVAEGIYYPDEGGGMINDDPEATFLLKDGLAIYGGFDPDQGVDTFEERQMWIKPILSGDIDQNDITPEILGVNATHVVEAYSAKGIILDSLVVEAGDGGGGSWHCGGGIENDIGELTLQNVVLQNNRAGSGGGLCNESAVTTMKQVTFKGNQAVEGGGIYSTYGTMTLTNVTFLDNQALCIEWDDCESKGGGMMNYDSQVDMTGVGFHSNRAECEGDICGAYAGAMYNLYSSPTLKNVTFNGNHAVCSGYYCGAYGGGVFNYWHSRPRMNHASFFNNSATCNGDSCYAAGGGMVNDYYSTPLLVNVDFTSNSTSGAGGGLAHFYSVDPTRLVNAIFTGNTGVTGGAVYNAGGELSLTNVALVGNQASVLGGGIVNDYDIDSDYPASLTLQNSILWRNLDSTGVTSAAQINNLSPASEVVIAYSLVQDSGGSGAYWNTSLGVDGGGNLDANPRFVRSPSPGQDGLWGTFDDDYGDLRLRPRSAAIDAGNSMDVPEDTLDLDSDGDLSERTPIDLAYSSRFLDHFSPDTGVADPPEYPAVVDMGAYELSGKRIFVDADAGGPIFNGTSWATAYRYLQDAMAQSNGGDEIWVAEGVYYPDQGGGKTDNDRAAWFVLNQGLALYGGFSGVETSLEQRDWKAHPTILSGDIDENDINSDGNYIAETSYDLQGDNSYRIVLGYGILYDPATIDGFTITAGQAGPGSSEPCNCCGGGMYLFYANLQLANLGFSGNWACSGGGLSMTSSNPRLVNITFSGNWAVVGGAIYAGYSNPSLVNVTFSRNLVEWYGGAMFNLLSRPQLINVSMSGNQGGYPAHPLNTWPNFPGLENIDPANGLGGAGCAIFNSDSQPLIVNSILWGNTGPVKAQIYNLDSTPTISNSLVQGSGSSGSGWDNNLGADGGGNLDRDPLFVSNPGAGLDGILGTGDDDPGDLHLQFTSPAIDAGNNLLVPPDNTDLNLDGDIEERIPLDLEGKPRFVDGLLVEQVGIPDPPDYPAVVDMGAYETPEDYGALTIYTNDFQSPVGSEWCVDHRAASPSGETFLGEFGNQTTCLTLTGLPAHHFVEVNLDLYIIRTWNGSQSSADFLLDGMQQDESPEGSNAGLGPDRWQFLVDGQNILLTTFSNWFNQSQSYPKPYPGGQYPAQTGATWSNFLRYKFRGIPMDAGYRLSFTVPHTGEILQLDFTGLGLQDLENESWGLDNLSVVIGYSSSIFPVHLYVPMIVR